MLRSRLTWLLASGMLATSAVLQGCGLIKNPGDIGVTLIASPTALNYGTSKTTQHFQLTTNRTSSPLGPVVATSGEPWIVPVDCTDPSADCQIVRTGGVNPVPIFIQIDVDRAKMQLGRNEGTVLLNASGASTEEVAVVAEDVLQINFDADTRTPELGSAVSFFDRTETTENGGEIVGRLWDFGDDSTSTAENPTHTYETAGLYTVSLTVITEDRRLFFPARFEETHAKSAFIAAGVPVGEGSIGIVGDPDDPTPNIIFVGGSITFMDLTDRTGLPPVTAWLWNFGDGETSDVESPAHIYDEPGIYTVTLTVFTQYGQETYVSEDFIIVRQVVAPRAQLFIDTPPPYIVDLPVLFRDLSDPGTGTVARVWDFGDGETSTEENPEHTYAIDDTFTITLTVTSEHGSDIDEQIIDVVFAPPTADFELAAGSRPDPSVGEEVQFVDTSVRGSDPITVWEWDFGDGATSNEQDPKKIYQSPGAFDVTLTVRTAGVRGNEGQVLKEAFISAIVPPAVSFNFAGGASPKTNVVAFTNTTVQGEEIITGYLWDFGDGRTSAQESLQHVYAQAGVYDVTLTVSTATRTAQATDSVEIVFVPPQPNFAISSNSVSIWDVVTFSNLTVAGTVPLDEIDFLWDFGDGKTSTNSGDPTHFYTRPEPFTVQLTATTANGPVTSAPQTINVSEALARFRVDWLLPNVGPTSGGNGVQLIGAFPIVAAISSISEAMAAYAVYFGDVNDASRRVQFDDEDQDPVTATTMNVIAPAARGSANQVLVTVLALRPDGTTLASTVPRVYLYSNTFVQGEAVAVDTANELVDGNFSSIANLIMEPGDDGRISLNEAILAANDTPGQNWIMMANAVGRITPALSLPALLDLSGGTTIQSNANFVLDGSLNTDDAPGLTILSGNNTLIGLTIVAFPVSGVLILGPDATNNLVRSCNVGIEGVVGNGNEIGIVIAFGASDNLIISNRISANLGAGVEIIQDFLIFPVATVGNSLRANSIWSNGGKGILLTGGANGGIAAPVITGLGGNDEAEGTAVPFSLIELFTDAEDEGRNQIDSGFTNGSGVFSVSEDILDEAQNDNMTATATDGDGNTSEFSAPFDLSTQ